MIAGCSGSGSKPGTAVDLLDRSPSELYDLELSINDDSLIGDTASAGFSLIVEETADSLLVTVDAESVKRLKAVYFDLGYDAAQLNPEAVESHHLMGASDELLSLAVLTVPGRVSFGEVIRNFPDRAGFSGQGGIATVRFAREPFRGERPAANRASALDPAETPLVFSSNDELRWYFTSPGDYDQNGEVGVSDLTPLGANFMATGCQDDISLALSVIDGDQNGEANVADITPIGANFGDMLSGYELYASVSPVDPLAPDYEGMTLLGTWDLADAQGGAGQRKYFTADLNAAGEGGIALKETAGFWDDENAEFGADYFFYAVPMAEDVRQLLSNPIGGTTGRLATSSLSGFSGLGQGTLKQPVMLFQDESWWEAGISIDVLTPEGGVADPADVTWYISDPDAGAIADGVLQGNHEFTGSFTIHPLYRGNPTDPPAWFFEAPLPPLPIYDDSIQAVPEVYEAPAGGEVLITVKCNSTRYPLHYMRHVRLTVPSGCYYRAGSFNVGSPGGAYNSPDGIWTEVGATGFILPSDTLYGETDLGDGLVGIDFNVTPIGGTDIVGATGDLFNFILMLGVGEGFTDGSEVHLSFQRADHIDRTFYSGTDMVHHYWSVDDNRGVDPITINMDHPYPDSIYAIPDTFESTPGGEVLVTVSCVASASPFHFMNLVRVVVPEGCYYLDDSFNVGSPGGLFDSVDGIWADVEATSFILPPDWMYEETDLGDGLVGIDFTITPFGGVDLTAGAGTGDLFNFILVMGTGEGFADGDEVYLGLQREDTIKRTYYGDLADNEYFWSNDTNASIPPITIQDDFPYIDSVYAVPDSYSAEPGGEVNVTVSCNQTANPLLHMSGVRLIVPTGVTYVSHSLNAGALGGAAGFIDGLWTDVGSTTLMLPPDEIIEEVDLGDGTTAIDFAIISIGGAPTVGATGDLFNVILSMGVGEGFAHGSEVHLGMQRTYGVDRTHYAESESIHYYWSVDDNRDVDPIVITEDFPYTDCIYATPDRYNVPVGEPILITVSCNETLSPFMHMSSVSVTMPQEATYVDGTFNVGSPGGAADDVDGLWSLVGPTGFVMSDDSTISEILIGDGRIALEFNITPVGGSEIANATGDLFNFEIMPGSGYGYMPGDEVRIGIRRLNGSLASVTHYQSADDSAHFWSHDTNSGIDPIIMAGP